MEGVRDKEDGGDSHVFCDWWEITREPAGNRRGHLDLIGARLPPSRWIEGLPSLGLDFPRDVMVVVEAGSGG